MGVQPVVMPRARAPRGGMHATLDACISRRAMSLSCCATFAFFEEACCQKMSSNLAIGAKAHAFVGGGGGAEVFLSVSA